MAAGLASRRALDRGAGGPRRRHRVARWLAVTLVVVIGHGLVIGWVAESVIGWGAADRAPRRLEVAFVHTLQQAAPPAAARADLSNAASAESRAAGVSGRVVMAGADAASVAARPKRRAPRPRAAAAEAAASALVTEKVASPPLPAIPAPAEAPSLDASPLLDDPLGRLAAAAASAPQASASGPALAVEDWPPSTRLHYTLTGNYRGAIGGTAEVRWVRVGTHYQVQMDVTVGLPFAPLMTRRVTSDGEITDDGLRPERYDEVTRRAFQPPWHVGVRFDRSMAWMSNGNAVFAPPGTQDSASEFVQLTWLFTQHPELLQPGRRISFPLALGGRVAPWVYEVGEPESLYTIFGDVPVVHVKPHPLVPMPRVLGVECWFAPTLQYLPARILVRENESTYIDLVLDRLPTQALPPSAPTPPRTASAPAP